MGERVAVCLSSLVGNHSDFLVGMRRYRSRHQLGWQLEVVDISKGKPTGFPWHVAMHLRDVFGKDVSGNNIAEKGLPGEGQDHN